MSKVKGLCLTLTIAIIATLFGHFFPIVGSAIFAMVIGMVLNNTLKLPESFKPGIQYSSKKVLHYSIILLGFTLSFQSIGTVGLKSLPILIVTLLVAFVVVTLLVKLFHIDLDTGILIGVGTSICGGSAVVHATWLHFTFDERRKPFDDNFTIRLFDIIKWKRATHPWC
ncbi:putative sulfate exporter family transporter [Staphylococcus pseudintermedius]|nr:putative sulfate exporter family transporter [Staphylococcus pseudintermedius]